MVGSLLFVKSNLLEVAIKERDVSYADAIVEMKSFVDYQI